MLLTFETMLVRLWACEVLEATLTLSQPSLGGRLCLSPSSFESHRRACEYGHADDAIHTYIIIHTYMKNDKRKCNKNQIR